MTIGNVWKYRTNFNASASSSSDIYLNEAKIPEIKVGWVKSVTKFDL